MCAPRSIHVAIPAPRSHVAKCSIFVARDPSELLPFATRSSLTRRRHPRTRSRAHPQHARTHRHRKRSVVAFSLFHAQPPALLPPHSRFAARPAAFLFFFRVPTLFLAGRSFFLFASRCAGRSFLLLASRCAARHARPPAKTRSLARIPTTDGRAIRRAVRRHG